MGLRWACRLFNFVVLFSVGSILASCTEQHRPEEHHKAIKAERLAANQPIKTLTKDGKIPAATSDEPKGSGNPKYDTLCASCHGLDGKADTPVAKAMNPRPRNFADAAWQNASDDARIAKVIKDGGVSVGLSATMAPWGAMISGDEMTKMVKTIRSFKP